ncbi:uncharacterized protein LOC129745689 isoform X3 [Uranotaenia lowii]|uniref:uncharacterized protein LOC129745689 isoform X3 n=1 Tax=Uranotaenia lowii TaxID=190385 RepID=UPI002479B569|nr:uncharacterized protein LOC129745689 isoform X3 [Uranotaenia lowii]XP_055594947.1 uncharacterized protein LOC129745689 isoform X3 [Uranotaenia lowii]
MNKGFFERKHALPKFWNRKIIPYLMPKCDKKKRSKGLLTTSTAMSQFDLSIGNGEKLNPAMSADVMECCQNVSVRLVPVVGIDTRFQNSGLNQVVANNGTVRFSTGC